MKWFGSAQSSPEISQVKSRPDKALLSRTIFIALLVAARKAEAHEEQIVFGCWGPDPG